MVPKPLCRVETAVVEANVVSPRVVVKVCCIPGLGQREVSVGYRLAHSAPMRKVIERVALKLDVNPASVELSAGGKEVGGEQVAGLFQDRLVTAHIRRV